MAGSVVQNVVVNVQREKKKKNVRRRRTGKRVALRSNNPLAYSGASSTSEARRSGAAVTSEFRIPTHSLQTNAALLMPARTLDDIRAVNGGGEALLGYVPRPPMPALAAVKTDGLLERVGQLEGNVKTGMRDAGKSFEHFDARLKTLQEHVGKSNLSEQRPIPRPEAPAPEAPAPEAPKPAPAKKPAYPAYVPLMFMGRRPKPNSKSDFVQRNKREVHRAEHNMKRAAYEAGERE